MAKDRGGLERWWEGSENRRRGQETIHPHLGSLAPGSEQSKYLNTKERSQPSGSGGGWVSKTL